MNNSPQKQALRCLILATALLTTSAQAENPPAKPLLDRNNLAIGGGLSLNSVDGPVDDEWGFQVFAGYQIHKLNLMQGVDSAIELGYMDYGYDGRDSDGLWATYVASGAITGQANWLARIGFDFGDDSGLMVGAGIGVPVAARLDLRLEYVVRDELDSIQLNLLYRL